ncbi:TetR/AcrR family transcriptional regulator [Streptomyces sp. GbtcB7]|uniref:TetR/AcrR family transcriptional regulator n=1 Tax=Streptomyces sp. GbtcB7 TaxID=2824752 RepID=UPI001C2F95C9|nr:TetR/AcrR family transcriptional regulator [Streptomyces sp. GbtcB7]
MSTLGRVDGYHHGDLRSACLDAALELLEEGGGDEATLSLRAVARRAGVSSNAPYRHYPDKGALLAALATRGFQELKALMISAEAAAAPGDAFEALAQAYVRYAIDHPGLFRFMYGHPCSTHPDTAAAAAETTAVIAARLPEVVPAEQREAFMVGCWSLVHGLGSLLLDGKLSPGGPDQVTALVHTVVATMLGPHRGAARE